MLRKQLLSSQQTSGNETRGHLQHRAFQQRLPTQGPLILNVQITMEEFRFEPEIDQPETDWGHDRL